MHFSKKFLWSKFSKKLSRWIHDLPPEDVWALISYLELLDDKFGKLDERLSEMSLEELDFILNKLSKLNEKHDSLSGIDKKLTRLKNG